MRVIEITTPGGPEVLRLAERPRPEPGAGEVLVRVVAAGVNRPDVQQRRGLYAPPPGASDIPGLDVAGVVEAVGPDVACAGVVRPRPGDAVCALVTGGGYAEHCVVPAPQCMPLPTGFGFVQAAALPEVFMTAWNNIIRLGRLGEGETVLMQGGTSGVGLAVIQIARHLRRARVFATAGTAEKRRVLAGFGVEGTVDYHGDWDTELRTLTGGRGFDVIVDGQAGPYTARQMDLLAEDGRLVLLATHLGTRAEIDLRAVVRRRLTLTGSTLRPRPPAYKGRLAKELVDQVWPRLADGTITMPICATFPLEQVAEAHAVLDANAQIGKVVLVVDPAGL
ncbi:NAD(P)H-quinone oxidoreductase [Rhodoplanes azumiensis]|uniref:NAD(P)H-quinone oxidoreductase n=1 Tax=Rhodoplanes azumiensis TaxID=1897628 RepID=A0ABW5AFG6_9BRAD